MSIVLKENEWAEKMIQSRTLGKKPSETLYRVARYYMDNGYSKKEARNKLDAFLIQCEPTSSLPKWSDALDYATNRASKYEAINIDYIEITKPEMDKIDALSGKQIQRLAFTLLCLAKYWQVVIPNGDYWINNKDNEIMSMANINTSIKRQGLMYWTLREAGMIQFSRKVDNTNVRVCFVEDGEVVCRVSDFRNLGYQYLKYHGEPYIECQNCGITTKINDPAKGRKQKYCKTCATEIAVQQRVNSVMRQRKANADNKSNETKQYIVYMHQSPNNKRYVGITTTTLKQRWKNGLGYMDNIKFYTDILHYGWEEINHYIVAIVDNESKARNIESCFIQYYKTDTCKNGYNRVTGSLVYQYDDNIIHNTNLIQVDGSGNELT